MGTEVLRPQDCLIQRIRVSPAAFNRRKINHGNGSPRTNTGYRKPAVRSDQRKKSPEPVVSKRSSSSEDFRIKHQSQAQNNLVSGSVTILKRGEVLNTKIKTDRDAMKKKADEMVAPIPDLSPVRLLSAPVASCRSDMYAGSAFSLSPSPRSLPLPSFFSKKQGSGSELVDDSATRDLRRLLRLD